MNEPLEPSPVPRVALAFCGVLAVCTAGGVAAPGPPTCESLAARIDRLPAEYRRGPVGETADARRERLIGQLEIQAALAAEAQAAGVDLEGEWRNRFARRRGALLLAALEDSFAAGVSVAPAEVEGRFVANRDRFRSLEKISTSFILLPLPPEATSDDVEDARRRLLEIRAEHAAGERFGALARRYSTAENAARGGAVKASPRGGLLAAYEDVAWSLRAGQVSEPFRLPDGMAIVRLENIFPARDVGLEEAVPGIEKRLAWEKRQARRESALADARGRWPTSVSWPSGAPRPAEIRFADEIFSLQDLGLAHRPPRLRARVAAELDRRLLLRLAEHRGLENDRPTAAALAALRESMLAASALERRVETLLPVPAEPELRALYAKDRRRFPDPERRSFEVLFLPGEEGGLRAVRDKAERLAGLWRAGRSSAELDLETWGPLTRAQVGGSTSPLLARIAFSLAAGGVSDPVRMERYRAETARFVAEGYVVLRLLDVEPAGTLPFEAVRARLAQAAVRGEREAVTRAERAAVAAGLDPSAALARFAGCALPAPARRSRASTPSPAAG